MRGHQLRESDKKKKKTAAEAKAAGAPSGESADNTELASGLPPEASGEAATEKPARERVLEVKVELDYYDRLKKLSDLAVAYQVIPNDYRGNIAGWVRWCLDLGEQTLRQYAMKRRGYT